MIVKGEPAFPGPVGGYIGMSLRDYFAAQALNGIFAGRTKPIHSGADSDTAEIVAGTCYEFADAMLAERAK